MCSNDIKILYFDAEYPPIEVSVRGIRPPTKRRAGQKLQLRCSVMGNASVESSKNFATYENFRKVYQFCAIEKVAYNENSYAVRINKHECRGSVKPLKEEFGNEEDGFWSEVPMEELHLLEVRSVRKFEKEFCLLQCCGSYVSLDLDADL